MKKIFFGFLFFASFSSAQTDFTKELRPLKGVPTGSTVTFEKPIFVPKEAGTIFIGQDSANACYLHLPQKRVDRIIPAGTTVKTTGTEWNQIVLSQESYIWCDFRYMNVGDLLRIANGSISIQMAPDQNTELVQF